jgi:hypothetical protein
MTIAEGMHRVVGLIAPVNERLGRFRVNFIPCNIALMLGLGALSVISWNSVARVLQNRRTPEPQAVADVLLKTRFSGSYVSVQGRLGSSRISVVRPSNSANLQLADYRWVPLVDDGGKALLVQFPGEQQLPGDGAEMTVEGMIRPMNAQVARQLKDSRYLDERTPIDRRFMLIAGSRPGSLSGPLMTGTLFGVLAVGLAWSILTRNVIFMPVDSGLSGGTPSLLDTATGEALLVSGTLALDAKTRRFFTNMPAVLQRLQSGDTALLSPIETSRRFMGLKTEQHSGVWMLAMRPGSITDAQAGYLFWGFKKMRATRFRYVNSMTGASERAVVASAADSTQPAYATNNPTLA